MQQKATKSILIGVEGAIFAAMAMVLSFIPTTIGASFSISLGMIPLTIYALKRGTIPGMLAGLVWGLLHFLTGQVYWLSVSQVLIEYVIAFPMAGLAGIVSKQFLQEKTTKTAFKWLIIGSLIGVLARYFWHFVAGVIFWGEYAAWGLSPVVFSFLMNGASAIATAFVTVIIVSWLLKMSPRIFANH